MATSLWLLGSFQLQVNGLEIHLPTHKAGLLLAYLVLHPVVHSREKLAAVFWGDVADEHARGSLRKALAHLRISLGEDLLLTDRQTVQFRMQYSLWRCPRIFEQQVIHFLAEDPPDLQAAGPELYRGRPVGRVL